VEPCLHSTTRLQDVALKHVGTLHMKHKRRCSCNCRALEWGTELI